MPLIGVTTVAIFRVTCLTQCDLDVHAFHFPNNLLSAGFACAGPARYKWHTCLDLELASFIPLWHSPILIEWKWGNFWLNLANFGSGRR